MIMINITHYFNKCIDTVIKNLNAPKSQLIYFTVALVSVNTAPLCRGGP